MGDKDINIFGNVFPHFSSILRVVAKSHNLIGNHIWRSKDGDSFDLNSLVM